MSQPTPAIIDRVRQRYGRILSHIELASREADTLLSEQQIWHLMARTASPRWATAYSTLQSTQQQISYLHSNENKPLGAIGAALHSEETIAAEIAHVTAQSRFTLIDENLRGKKFLGMLLEDLVARQKSLEVSMGISEGVLRLTLEHQPAMPVAVQPLRSSFGVWARKLITPARKATLAMPKV